MTSLSELDLPTSTSSWSPPSLSSPSSSSLSSPPSSNCSAPDASSPPYNFYAVLLVLLIFCVVFGNVLVCVAVWAERTLHTTTNYLIVSLAVSDLLLATLVMPWAVVGEWGFSLLHCDLLLTLDVMMCTASILNLCAISIDSTRCSSRRRVALMISIVWFLSFAISCPLLFGLNHTASRDGRKCSFADPSFVVYSSVASFYVPFIVTLLVYAQICVLLRRLGRRTAPPGRPAPAGKTHHLDTETPPTQQGVSEPGDIQRLCKNKCTHPEDVKLCTLMLRPPTTAPQCKKVTLVTEAVVHPVEAEPGRFLSPCNHALAPPPQVCVSVSMAPRPTGPRLPLTPRLATLEGGMRGREGWLEVGERGRGRLSQQKERKATQMLAIVLGEEASLSPSNYLSPPYCPGSVTWLGYLNSAVNPVIYTTFNIEFRKAFQKILHC
ncbi:hypothetical protein NHX12_000885 [Muraenolepis orangiensis]|uniref:G-protein coupled receptors family 1 profile domain-containing protein n=1 Tax=Muraenolepis orangiensis TaxID=630683 RepID=A0A9Q0IEF8_9TELE|nr:hypothetical protein NHX12_000885 [Muraenolepis orangiensis]